MMKATWQWIDSYVGTGLDASTVAERLTLSGTEVEKQEPVGDDVCFTLEVTSNRTDCLSVIGLARELAATTGKVVKHPPVKLPASANKASTVSSVSIEPAALKACPYYTAQVIRGVKVGPSPKWLQQRLEGIGLKPINNIVDITNFVLFETGQPLHAFDMGKLKGGRIVVRMARAGERFDPLVDRKRDKPAPEREFVKCDTDTLVICDAENPQAVGGIMGGLTSGVTNATTDILLESAYFDPAGIRATSRRLELDSDSSYRFERGVDPMNVVNASKRAAALIVECAGGEVLEGVLEAGSVAHTPAELLVNEALVQRVMGKAVPATEIARIFVGLDVPAIASGDRVTVRVPSFRRDLERPIDLVEEVARVHGLEKFPAPLRLPVSIAGATRRQRVRRVLRAALLGMGFSEALTDTFVPNAGLLTEYGRGGDSMLRLEARNPVNVQAPALRRNLLGSLASALTVNQRQGQHFVRLYEIAEVFQPAADGKNSGEREVLGLIGRDFADVKGALEALLRVLRAATPFALSPLGHPVFETGRASELSLGGRVVGVLGELSAKALSEREATGPAAVAELDFDALVNAWVEVPKFTELPRFPTAERDLAFVLDASTTWAAVEACVHKACDATLREVRLFDEFTGKQIGAGRKSLAFRLYFRHDDRTLTTDEIAAQTEAAAKAITSQLKGTLRG